MWQSYKPLVTIYIILPPFVNSSLLENSYFAVLYPFTSYVKLQQAYVSEAATNFGDWTIIGYKAPGDNNETTNFTYAQPAGVTYTNNSAALSTTAASVWQASNNSRLNDCPAAANWTLSIAASTTTAGEVKYEATVATDCEALTPSFTKIGNTSAAGS